MTLLAQIFFRKLLFLINIKSYVYIYGTSFYFPIEIIWDQSINTAIKYNYLNEKKELFKLMKLFKKRPQVFDR